MVSLPITLTTASILGLMLVWLSIRVINARVKGDALIGDAGDTALLFNIRTHANFTEYSPLFIVILGLLEFHGGNQTAVAVLAIVFVIARILHVFGMGETANLKFRQVGMVGTFICLVAASAYGLYLNLF